MWGSKGPCSAPRPVFEGKNNIAYLVRFHPVLQTMKAFRESRVIAVLCFRPRH
jgi:hypothetical protein